MCKILEIIIRDTVTKHMKDNNLFNPKQFGFLAGRSTELQQLKVLDIWTHILDQGDCIDVIYCDFMKAFDKVPHNRLLYKVEKYSTTGNTLEWIKSFLSDRTQQVIINDSKSGCAPVTSGIPQGSVLGPLLFVMYINDLPDIVDKDSYECEQPLVISGHDTFPVLTYNFKGEGEEMPCVYKSMPL